MSRILQALADLYRSSAAGRRGSSAGDFTCDYQKLLKAAHCQDGEERITAQDDLFRATHLSAACLTLDTHPRDPKLILRVRLAQDGGEAWLFKHLALPCPSSERAHIARLFDTASAAAVPAEHQENWQSWCNTLSSAALSSASMAPFSRSDPAAAQELLQILPRLLSWQGESMIRFASCVLCGDSKRLTTLQSRLETALHDITSGTLSSFDDLGLVETPRRVLLHGPLQLTLPRGTIDLGLLSGSVTLSEWDIASALEVTTTAERCLTVENETTFHELTKRNTDTLLIQTSYPGRATLDLLRRLPTDLAFFHFGDTDPAGFDILRDLRQRTGRVIHSHRMDYRHSETAPPLSAPEHALLSRLIRDPLLETERPTLQRMFDHHQKGAFEQESLGRPSLVQWPFYPSSNPE